MHISTASVDEIASPLPRPRYHITCSDIAFSFPECINQKSFQARKRGSPNQTPDFGAGYERFRSCCPTSGQEHQRTSFTVALLMRTATAANGCRENDATPRRVDSNERCQMRRFPKSRKKFTLCTFQFHITTIPYSGRIGFPPECLLIHFRIIFARRLMRCTMLFWPNKTLEFSRAGRKGSCCCVRCGWEILHGFRSFMASISIILRPEMNHSIREMNSVDP